MIIQIPAIAVLIVRFQLSVVKRRGEGGGAARCRCHVESGDAQERIRGERTIATAGSQIVRVEIVTLIVASGSSVVQTGGGDLLGVCTVDKECVRVKVHITAN